MDRIFGDSHYSFNCLEKVVTIGSLRIGIVHGHQVTPWGNQKGLEAVQRALDVDILIHGHTQQYKVWKWYLFRVIHLFITNAIQLSS